MRASSIAQPRGLERETARQLVQVLIARGLKRRWRVSVAALVRRARDLDRLSDASYRRACIHLNRAGERVHEHDEPAFEAPSLIVKALDAAQPDISVGEILERAALPPRELEELLDMGLDQQLDIWIRARTNEWHGRFEDVQKSSAFSGRRRDEHLPITGSSWSDFPCTQPRSSPRPRLP